MVGTIVFTRQQIIFRGGWVEGSFTVDGNPAMPKGLPFFSEHPGLIIVYVLTLHLLCFAAASLCDESSYRCCTITSVLHMYKHNDSS